MSTARKLLSGSALKFIALGLQVAFLMVLTPKMLQVLGVEAYGFWQAVLAVIGSFGVIELGISQAVTRFVSRALGRDDMADANRFISSSFAIFNILGLVVLVCVLALAAWAAFMQPNHTLCGDNPVYLRLYPIMLAAFGAQLAVSFPARVVTAIVKSHMRFDFIAIAMIARILFTNGLIGYMLFMLDLGLFVTLLYMTAAACVGFVIEYLILLRVALKSHPGLPLAPFRTDKDSMRSLAGYSAKSMAGKLAFYINFRVDSLLVATKLDQTAVTYYSIPQRLIVYFYDIMGAVLGNFVPIFSQYHGREEMDLLRQRFLEVMRISIVITTFVGASMAFYGGAFIEAWVGDQLPDHQRCYHLLLILLVPLTIDLIHIPAHGIFYATNRHHHLAWLGVVSAVLKLILAFALMGRMELEGLAWAHAISNFATTVITPVLACMCIALPAWRYILGVFLPTISKSLLVLGLYFILARSLLQPSFLSIGILAILQTAIYGPLAIFVLMGHAERELLDKALGRRLRLVERGEKLERFRKFLFIPVLLILGAVLLGFIGDFGYSRYVRSKLKTWEQSIERDADGVRKNCAAFTLRAADSAPAILMIHGFGDSANVWRLVAPELRQQGYHVRAMRLPGMAEPLARAQAYGLQDWRAALRTEIALLARADQQNARQILLVGHSTGAALALDYIHSEGNEHLAGLVLVCPAFAVSNVRSPLLPSETWYDLVRPYLTQTTALARPFGTDLLSGGEGPLVDEVIALPVFDAFFALLATNRAHPVTDGKPIHMMLSTQDEIVDNLPSQAWFDQYQGTKSRSQCSSSGHVVPLDGDWLQLANEIKKLARETMPTDSDQ